MDSSVSPLSARVSSSPSSAARFAEAKQELHGGPVSKTLKLVPLPAGTQLASCSAPVAPLAFNPAMRALEKRAGGGPSRDRGPLAHMRSVLASPTDKLMSPATRGVHDIRRKKLSKEKLKPQALSMVFESMKQK
ncbi:hypothetical protein LPJ60_000860 [Coemansia sp. RSA 2675]|uniref:Uncharacterized protein n=1 Tax=Coemansia linderi TaxID=2663919 RepID=A0ACC1KPJ2_9FUNG|nr:hypothetical protein LPJ60_000860 [Coemansia sp. RSA 2675]KAJ2415763.1 hypothetical protein GGI10_001467 [Coemansia sp. RSA 2530]KAJ2701014.1 hypothetical protein H4218_001683 [Coemansia sp. IMI 209128]KAJ2792718.1 hypothetical protein GGI18_000185 [Coemansia linderi]